MVTVFRPGEHIAIVGAGHAGTEAAFALRQEGFSGAITLLNGEEPLPYHRPPLSKSYFAQGVATPLRSQEAFEQAKITLRPRQVTEIHRAQQTLRLDKGDALSYDHLILALGAKPNHLPTGNNSFFSLNDLDSAERLRNVLPDARSVAIIGAGFIGMEFAAAAAAVGKKVAVIDRAARVLERATSPAVSNYLHQRHEARGIQIILSVDVTKVQQHNSGGHTVHVSNGTSIDADIVVEAVGVSPRLELARAAGLDTAIGIVVSPNLITSDPCISAIGDCAQFPTDDTSAIVITSVQNASDQAKHVARRLHGGATTSYCVMPWFWSDQADDKLQIVGIVRQGAKHVLRYSKTDRAFSVFSFHNNKLTSIETLNSPAEHILARRLMGARGLVRPEQVEDAGFDLTSLIPKTR